MKVDNRLEGYTIIYAEHNGREVGKLYGQNGDFFWGGQGVRGRLMIQTADNKTLFEYDAERNVLVLRNREGKETFCINGETGDMYLAGAVKSST